MQRIKTFKTLTCAVAAACFLAVQAAICIGTVYWAIAATLRMEGTAAIVLGAIFALPSAYVLMVVTRTAYDAETDPANQ
ncbi:hypothetical protein LB534_08970 [Mesorhizobium sp. CA18]|uniref:hypothetical protein n=1 Tax=unclassified Mesorhizobium TaxID=325217 RepID=UPI001CCD9D00|nr:MULTISPECIES: hypothetical protein [unclassified Mesorhizobium]MBZ9733741.1 hypothetical protein [Mesorhizobium sp. CA9]MBZ9825414.1 hypothetical protein [Mesorhizobium sp. CA18]MBZ9834426.1 hypothetical protein [Mesorhizobium sp. CA2]MBZ9836838.1 hypothetical protein [Mesorhizobium sp. CA3]MBZ9875254.1 hypothetical protein [Mesorhizobium sp. Ca11]